MRAGTPSVSIAEGRFSGQDATVIVQDVSVIVAEALLRRVRGRCAVRTRW